MDLHQAFIEESTSEVKARLETIMHAGQKLPESPIIPIDRFIELMSNETFSQSLPLKIDVQALIRDVRRFEMADQMALAVPFL